MKMLRKKINYFSFVEIALAISLVVLASSLIGWKMVSMMEKKRFASNAERLKSRLLTCRRLAMNMQSDFRGTFAQDGKKWIFQTECVDEPNVKTPATLSLEGFAVFLDGKQRESIAFDFTSSGGIFPHGFLMLQGAKGDLVEWKLPDMFFLKEGVGSGPLHPDD